LIKNLPFTLTTAQEKSLTHIFDDVKKQQPMNRLVEGDVGSGKTIVAAISMYLAFLNGYQSVLMAPTEILAQQHFATISKFLEPFGVKIALQTGSKKNKEETFDILVGTHAVLSNKINFDKLGLVVIDEQQRFGVQQRSVIRAKGKNPHFLTMTATPIPRTIALTMYGDLDLSVLDELPKGRKLIKTWLVPQEKRTSAYQWIEKQIKETDSQAFIICPFIEESESMTTIKAATKEFEYLTKNVFPNLKLGLLHGKMKAKEKDIVLEQFRNKAFDILIATPVVEVGIDIPNATIIVIEAAERFGLSQLHQLRGRVGRGDKQSYCLLFTESKNPQTIERLKAMEKMHIGSQLAEFDLQLRGAGDMYGTAQHGQTFFKIASFADVDLIEKANQEAEKIFPELEKYPKLIEKLAKMNNQEVSPD
jgi:ATP-dependent DNA helicase RecG